MNILIVNDDGINSRGMEILVRSARNLGKLFVVAPKTQQSAVSQGITIHSPLEIDEEKGKFEGVSAWSISGKPADCVKVAIEYLRLDIDLCISGVNDGPNLGTDILYSGTVAGASEACVFNIPSISISTDFGSWSIAEKETEKILRFVIDNKIAQKGIITNINFPSHGFEDSKGIKFTRQGDRLFSTVFRHDQGKYWQEGEWKKSENPEDTDVYAFENGFISVSPLSIDRTNHTYLENLKKETFNMKLK